MCKNSSLIIIFMVLGFSVVNAENIDSLIAVTSTSKSDVAKIQAFIELSNIYKYDSTQLAEKYAAKALAISIGSKNDTMTVQSINTLCPVRVLLNDNTDVPELYNKALKISEKLNDKRSIGVTCSNFGTYYNKQNNLDSALCFYLKASEILEKSNELKLSAQTFNNVGIIYYKKANYEKSIDYFIKSLKVKEMVLPNGERVANDNQLAASMVNIGLFYMKINKDNPKAIEYLKNANSKAIDAGNNSYACIAQSNLGIAYNTEKQYDSALYYHKKALILAEKMNNIQRKSHIYTGLANVYTNTGEFDLAIEYFLKSLELHEQIKDFRGQAVVEKNIMQLYLEQDKYMKAKEFGEKALKTAQMTRNTELEKEVYFNLSKIYENLNNYENALQYIKKYNSINDSLFTLNNKKQIAEIQTKYETEKKNVEIKELKINQIEAENDRKVYLILIAFLGILTLVFIVFFRQKQKTNKILNAKNDELQQLNATQNRLISIISHDFKAPLAAFYSITNSIKNKFDKIDRQQIDNYLTRMLNSSISLKMQLENMLNWAISQKRNIKPELKQYNLQIITYKIVMILQEFANEKSITIENNIDDSIELITDGKLLGIVLNNLITNAVKFSESKSKVIVSAKRHNEKVLLSIKDFGMGMSDDDVAKLFKSDKQVTQNENSGTGLGLIVCKEIIENMGGKIWAESKLGVGSEFFVEL